MHDLIDGRLGQYQILEELGRGGMAVVYKAYQPALDRHVAIKVLPQQFTFDEEFVERFLREARAVAQLNHPHIVTIHDVGEIDGTYFIVMEYVEGPSLSELLRQHGALSQGQTLNIVSQVASALDYAHERGFVHRDVKPSNVLLGAGGEAKLADFGIVRTGEGTRLTQTGTLLGTPEYMSPEQARGRELDRRSDIYSLGVVAYEMLTGRTPFQGDTAAVLHGHGYEAPNLSALPKGTQTAMDKVLAKDPGKRYGSAGAFSQALEAVLSEELPESPSPPLAPHREMIWRHFKRVPAGVWAIGGLAVLAVVIGVLTRRMGGLDSDIDREATIEDTALPVAEAPVTTTPIPSPTPVAALSPTPPPASSTTPELSGSSPPGDAQSGDTLVRPKDGMPMVYVPGGSFLMGSEAGEGDERPVHSVELGGFWIDRLEITNLAFEQFVIETGFRTEAEEAGWGSVWRDGQWQRVDGLSWRHPTDPNVGFSAIPDHPVVQVSWNDAHAYCEWAEARLPTEAEWEMAAVGATGWRYPWGSEFDPGQLNASGSGTTRVGSYQTGQSPCGALDMAGNVWEWVSDWYQSDYYTISPAADPEGPASGTHKALRGGGWDPFGGDSRSADRGALPPGSGGNTVGFRCAASPVGSAPSGDQATPQPTLTPMCPAVSGPFEVVWTALVDEVGCATDSPVRGLIVEENFEGGKMFWREPIDHAQALVLFRDGTWQLFQHTPYAEGMPEFSCPDENTPSQCPPTPKRGFGMMWCDIPEIRSGLGNATDCERGYQGSMQQFEQGFMLQTDSGTIYVLYDSGSWERR